MVDFVNIAKKWQKKWDENKVFEVEVTNYNKKKYYITTPYPYVNGLLHLGHLYTYNFPEVLSRYKRMQGFNVLFKYAFHCTGTPIVAASKKVKEKEPGQLETLRKMGISSSEISKFEDPLYWIKYFPGETLKDIKGMGYSIDGRYSFITTSLNKPYDAMIAWQFNKLKEKGLVKKGKHPVIWCPKDNVPVGDHDRAEGEGETLKDFIWIKFKLKKSDLILMAGTTRPDALLGQTHLWVEPDAVYKIVKVNDEKWVVGSESITKIKDQYGDVSIIGEITSKELIGMWAKGPLVDYELYIVPAWFIDSKVGSGIVYSALEDPVDLIEIQHLQKNLESIKKYKLDPEVIKQLKPISIIKIEGMGDNLGQEMIKKYDIQSPKQAEKIKDAKDELNRTVFRKGIMKKNCGKYSGLDVPRAQEVIKQDLMNSSSAVMFHEMTGKVVCRCLTECIIKMVSDQWFIEYNNEDWKKLAHKCLDKMDLYPDKVRKQFDYVLDWLHRWACTREFGLGTKLPWDNKWVIESLSDSTLQMAYCTISKYLEHSSSYGFSVDKLNDSFFNYIFLGKGNVVDVVRSTGINKVMIETMKSDFNYWYPFDFRNSAKDLIQNHLAFTIFNHTAIFENKYWPRAYVLNGRVMVNNEKMSKSKGNFFTMRELYGKHGADIVRLTSANAGEGLNDANYDMEFLSVATSKLNDFFEFVNSYYDKGRTDMIGIDKWFESKINSTIKESTVCMDTMLFKSAVQSLFLDLHRHLRWYMKRTDGSFNKKTINKYVETQILLLGPFTPHFCEEMWSSIGKKGFLSNASWPKFDSSLIDISLDDGEELIKNTISDIREVLKLAKITSPSNIKLFVSDSWKYDLFREVNSVDSINQKEIIGHVMKDARFKKYGKVIFKFLPKMISSRKVPVVSLSQKEELAVLKESIEFIKKDFDCAISVISASESKENKARNAMPLKPAILVE